MASTLNQAEALNPKVPLDSHEDDNGTSGQYTLDNCDDCHPLMIALARIFDNIGVSSAYVYLAGYAAYIPDQRTCLQDLSFVFPDNEVEKARRVLSQRPDRFVQRPCQSDRSNSAGWEFVCADPNREERRCHYPELGPMEVALPEVHYVYYGYCLRYLAIPAMCEQSLFITARDWHADCAKWFCYAGYAVDYIDDDRTGPSRDSILGETLRTLLVEKDFMIIEKLRTRMFPECSRCASGEQWWTDAILDGN
ncbi:hypothetical protein EVG20_g11380 [Dentipellis fragilis]|uniref:Uncharacterized protein n=1 Tax=Dentipellis fragilis TaxID=205917 RepID=A0A4Y9XKZ3_9AGAM|nr:hypothetical protein EVG20_g11380 [Dentipellis fragilis]